MNLVFRVCSNYGSMLSLSQNVNCRALKDYMKVSRW